MYRAEISGDNKSLLVLCKNFSYVKNRDGKYYLECPEFNSMNDHSEIFDFADEILMYMLSTINLVLNNYYNAEINTIEDLKKDGSKGVAVRVSNPATFKLRINPPVIKITDKEGNVKTYDPEIAPLDLKPYLKCIYKNDKLKEVVEYLDTKNDSNFCFNYYAILEIIGKDLGSKDLIPKNISSISRNKFKKLKITLNNGMEEKSRHYPKSKSVNKKNIITEKQISLLMSNIIMEWFKIKCKTS